jgi:putative transposase
MGNSYHSLHYHFTFSTKNRQRWIKPEIGDRLWSYLGGIASQNKLKALCIGGADDHVHLLLAVPPTVSVAQALKLIKGGSSGWIKQHLAGCAGFAWQDGYGAFTVSRSHLADVERYIRSQREHHKVRTFHEEYRTLLERHKIEYAERYLWD